MKTKSSLRCGLAAVCFVFLLRVTVAWAGIQPEPFRTGLFGVTTGQSIRISIVNAGESGGVINPCVPVFDAAGNLLSETDAGPVAGGTGTFVDFTPAPGGAVVRTQLRVEVELVPAVHPPDPAHPPDPVHPPDPIRQNNIHVTLEVFDTAAGRTVFTMPFAKVAGVDPKPFAPVAGVDPTPFRTGLFGVTTGQAIRISVLNAGDVGGVIEPCFRVFDAAGALLSETDAGPVPGGTGTFVDFTPLPGGAASRAQMRVEVTPVPDHGAPVPDDGVPAARRLLRDIIPTLEVFDTATGRTVYTMPYAVAGFNPQPEPEPIRQP